MSRRTRFTAGILALLALTFSFAESVWASTCSPLMDMGVPATAELAESALDMDHRRGDPAGHDRDRSEHEQPCPFGSPAAAQACSGALSLPAHTSLLPAPSLQGVVAIFTVDLRRDLLLERALFRPPRA